MPTTPRHVRTFKPSLEQLEDKLAAGNLLTVPALAPIYLFGLTLSDFGQERALASQGIPDAGMLQVVNALSNTSGALDPQAVDAAFGGLDDNPSSGTSTLAAPEHADTTEEAPANQGALFALLGNLVISASIAQATAEPLAMENVAPPASGGGTAVGAETTASGNSGGTAAGGFAGGGGASAASGSTAPSPNSPPSQPGNASSGINWQLLTAVTQPNVEAAAAHAGNGHGAPPQRYGIVVPPTWGAHAPQPELVPIAPSSGRPEGYSLGNLGKDNGHGHGQSHPAAAAHPGPFDPDVTTDEDHAVNIYWLTYGDTDPNGYGLSVAAVQQPSHGATVLNTDGTVTYTPGLHYSGTDTFTYTISNGHGSTQTGVADVTVTPVHYPPTVNNVNVSTNENTPVTVTLSGSSIESLPLTYAIDAGPSNGTLGDFNGNTITYYPGGNFTGTDTFTYVANDGDVTGADGTVTITVNSVTLSPGVTITPPGDGLQIAEQGSVSDDGETTDQSGTYTVVLNTQPAAAVTVAVNAPAELAVDQSALTFTPSNWSTPQAVTVTAPDDDIAEGDHTVTITHTATSSDPNYNGIAVAGLPVAIADSDVADIAVGPGDNPDDLNEVGPTSSDFPITLTSQPVDDVTVTFTPDSYETVSPTSLIFTPNDWTSAQTVTVTAVNTGTVLGYHTGTITITASGDDPAYSGVSDNFSVNILDANGPNALPVSAETDENGATTFNVLSNDSDPNGYSLTVSSVSQPADGTVVNNGDGTLSYTPNADWSGDDTFSYTISNGQGGTATGSIDVTTDFVDQPPVVTNPGDQTSQTDTAVSVQVQATNPNDSSSDLFYSASGLPPGLIIDPMKGTIWGWIDPEAAGDYDTIVTVTDVAGNATSVEFDWTVTVKDHGPVLWQMGDALSYVGDSASDWGSPEGALDIDGYSVTYTLGGDLPAGLSYDPTTNVVSGTLTTPGAYPVTVTASDGHGGTDQNTFTWYVLADDDTMPLAFVNLGASALGGDALLLANPPTPMTGTVSVMDPANPDVVHTVTLDVPSGSSTLSQSSFSLSQSDGSVPFTVTPTAVSQKLWDVVIVASVDGLETCRVDTTNVGIEPPQDDITGEDSTAGMPDRVGTEAGGAYAGVLQVYPILMGNDGAGRGYNIVDLWMEDTGDNSNDGAAAVDDPEAGYENKSVIQISETAETDIWDGTAYTEKLQLVAQLNNGVLGAQVVGKQAEAVAIRTVNVQFVVFPGATDTTGADLDKANQIFGEKGFIKFVTVGPTITPKESPKFFRKDQTFDLTVRGPSFADLVTTYNNQKITYAFYVKGMYEGAEIDPGRPATVDAVKFTDGYQNLWGQSNFIWVGTTQYKNSKGDPVTWPGPRVLAHELGHRLRLFHKDHAPGDLMYSRASVPGFNLNELDIKILRNNPPP
jgi:hypothetical protein